MGLLDEKWRSSRRWEGIGREEAIQLANEVRP